MANPSFHQVCAKIRAARLIQKLGGMLLSSLMDISYSASGNIEVDALREAPPCLSEDVLVQVYADHGRNSHFQKQYGHLDLSQIVWRREVLRASEIITCSVWPNFRDWLNDVAGRADKFATQGWSCIDIRPDVRKNWESNGSWIRPPVLLHSSLVSSPQELHLVEGHTRVGLLKGLVEMEVLPGNSEHAVSGSVEMPPNNSVRSFPSTPAVH